MGAVMVPGRVGGGCAAVGCVRESSGNQAYRTTISGAFTRTS